MGGEKKALASALRIMMAHGLPSTGEVISEEMAREIYALTHGVRAADEEFGKPTGKDALPAWMLVPPQR